VAARRKKKKILVVDDEPEMQIFLSRLLQTAGIQAIVARNGAEGLRKARTAKPVLIILDMMMPGIDVTQLYCNLKSDAELREIPVIMLSNLDRKTFFHYQKIQFSLWGAGVPEPEAYLKKPPEAEEFIGMVRSLTQTRDRQGKQSVTKLGTAQLRRKPGARPSGAKPQGSM
jgi:CheY-like chemotaxis protein